MFWNLRKRSITIPVELHEKMAQTCGRIEAVPSAVLRVRPLKRREQERGKMAAGLKPTFLCGT